MAEEHKKVIIDKCSAQDDPIMPDLPLEENQNDSKQVEEEAGEESDKGKDGGDDGNVQIADEEQ